MRIRRTIICSIVFAAACGEEPVVNDALAVDPLSTTPGCFSPLVTLAPCEEDECTAARAANRSTEEQIDAVIEPLTRIVDAIRSAPNDELWEAEYVWPEPHDLRTTYTITPTRRGSPTGAFDVVAWDVGQYVPSGGVPTEVNGTRDLFGFYTPNFTVMDLSDGIIRWTAHAVTAGSFYRGCDPGRGVSFDQRYLDDGSYTLFCWDNSGGNEVDCQTVNLWPDR